MLKTLRAEHILAIILTGIFLLCDIAVLCFFISAFDPAPEIASATDVAEHHIVQTPELSVRSLTNATFGLGADSQKATVQQLEEAISIQLKSLTQTKSAP